jgi:hypothetical protein
VRFITHFLRKPIIGSCVLRLLGVAMFDYVSAQEIQLLRKLRAARAHDVYVTSNQRIRLELLGLLSDGPNGIQLTAKGLSVAQAGYDAEGRSEFEPLIVRLAS